MSDSKEYKVSAAYKKSTYTHEHWTNTFNDKNVTAIITTIWRWGDFIINATDEEKEEILKKDSLIINDHYGEFICTTDGCERYAEIKNPEKYSQEELLMIKESLFEDVDDEILHDECIFEDENDWVLDDTIYEICGEVDMELNTE